MSAEFRAKFEEKLQTLMSEKDTSSFLLTKEKYLWIIDRLDLLTSTVMKKKSKDYRLLNRYEVVIMPGTGEKKLQKRNTTFLYVSDEDLFDVIHAIHIATGHGARDVMNARVKKKYANVTKEVLQLFADMCDECQAKKGKKITLKKPVSASAVSSRCQVDVVDVQMNPNEHYHYIMSYQDQRTKYVCLRALQTADAKEVSAQLIDIFCVFGAPCILQSYNGREFARKVIREVRNTWSKCVLVYGKASEKRILDKDIVSILNQWMKENQTNKWVDGLRYVQWEKNNTEDPDINKTPHAAMFNSESILGLHSSNLPIDIIDVLEREEDLVEVVNGEVNVKVEEVSGDEALEKPVVRKIETEQQEECNGEIDTPDMTKDAVPEAPEPTSNDRNNSSEDDGPNSTSSSSNSDSEQFSETGSSSDDHLKVTSHVTSQVKAASRDYLPPDQIQSQQQQTRNYINLEAVRSVWELMMERNNGSMDRNVAMSLGSGGSGSETGESSSRESSSRESDGLTITQQTREGLKREFLAAAAEESENIINAMAKRFKSVDVKSDADSSGSK